MPTQAINASVGMVSPPIIFDTPVCLTVREVAARARRARTSSGSRGLLAVDAGRVPPRREHGAQPCH
jgi:hypothetical protein